MFTMTTKQNNPQNQIQDSILEISIDNIKPSQENDLLYKPIDPNSSDIIELAISIRENGLLEPITVTKDHYILSGHRRYTACQVAGLKEIKIRYYPIYSDSPDLEKLLVEFNSQRIKSIDTLLKENLVKISKEDAHRILVQNREEKSKIDLKPNITIKGSKKRHEPNRRIKEEYIKHIKIVLKELKSYYPLSVRQVFYNLLNYSFLKNIDRPDSKFRNCLNDYSDLSRQLTTLRVLGEIPYESFEDDTRPVSFGYGNSNANDFIKSELNGFLNYYSRNLLSSQENYFCIYGEKNTIANVVNKAAMKYCMPSVISRGNSSITARYKIADDFLFSGKKNLVLLILTDFDPDGESIAHSTARSFRDDFNIDNVMPFKVALNFEQIEQYNIPQSFTKAKVKSKNFKSFYDKYGEYIYELEALHPRTLESVLDESIRSVIDIDLFNKEIEQEKEESLKILEMKEKIKTVFTSIEGGLQ